MALIKCPECGREISDHATACPGCGFPIKSSEIPFTIENKMETPAEQPAKEEPAKPVVTPPATPKQSAPAKPVQPAKPAVAEQPKVAAQPVPPLSEPARGRAEKKKPVATIVAVSLVIIALLGAAIWFLFPQIKQMIDPATANDELESYRKIERFKNEGMLDSLEIALEEYFDEYSEDSFEDQEFKDRFRYVEEINDAFTSERNDWKSALGVASVDAFNQFLDNHPDGFYRVVAMQTLDSVAFNAAVEAKTKEALERYIDTYPNGKFIEKAQEKIAAMEKVDITDDEKHNAVNAVSQHFEALANNNRASISLTLADEINSYLGKTTPTIEDIYDYMSRMHATSRNVRFQLTAATVKKENTGIGAVYNVHFALVESNAKPHHDDEDGESAEEDLDEVDPDAKHFSGTATLNQYMKITTLILNNATKE